MLRKFTNALYLLLIAAVASMALTACGGDDDEPTPPAYANEAAKYVATSTEKGIESFELTASGQYIIVSSDNQSLLPSEPSGSDFARVKVGNFTVNADGSLNLAGYGSATIAGSQITLTPTGGAAITLSVRKASMFADSQITLQLCRAWDVESYGLTLTMGNASLFDRDAPVNGMTQLVSDYLTQLSSVLGTQKPNADNYVNRLRDELPYSIIFTRAATMLVRDSKGSYRLCQWRWRSETNRVIEVAAPGTGLYDSRYIVDVNNAALMLRSIKVENEGQTPEITTTTTWSYTAR